MLLPYKSITFAVQKQDSCYSKTCLVLHISIARSGRRDWKTSVNTIQKEGTTFAVVPSWNITIKITTQHSEVSQPSHDQVPRIAGASQA